MRVPLSTMEFDTVLHIISSGDKQDCAKCEKWRIRIRGDLRLGNFDDMKKGIMHLVNHLQNDGI